MSHLPWNRCDWLKLRKITTAILKCDPLCKVDEGSLHGQTLGLDPSIRTEGSSLLQVKSSQVCFIVNSSTCTVHTYRELKLRYCVHMHTSGRSIDHNATRLWCNHRLRLIYPHPTQLYNIQWGKKFIWSPDDCVHLPTDKEMICL